ncbi:TetR/AcrR family transcriptional regulator [Gordonia rhizosphera]|uniref:Putative TetR family transcriptional regulator n=1 Tax=Gordonia rhizosphera NBRC 16068 TaxID=1108045 RepID=K6WFC1_9ACTN|nr:TetR/AcrR family transcriptional regulator [Gordonia rhizosphera]GAB90857.1 putative TetR family transcriptional regulator [Gordonia rhizosphera NBRC 16068]
MSDTPTGRAARPARARILDAAARQFYAHGIAATGIDTITADAGVAKMSLYNNFSSKADLVSAYLDERHREWMSLYAKRCEDATTPSERIIAVFDAYADHAALAYDHGFRGCGLLNAAAELPVDDPGRDAVRRHKEEVESILRTELAALCEPRVADACSEHLSFLLEGAMSRAGLEGTPDRLGHARTLAESIVAAL